MLRISKLTDYGSVILAYMASHPEQTLSAASLSRAVYLPLATVSKLMKLFKRNGLVKSTRGKDGGYMLSRPAEEISLAQIISVIEGPIALTECSVKKNLCQVESHCVIRPGWQSVNRAIYNSLSQVTLDSMLETSQENRTETQPLTVMNQ